MKDLANDISCRDVEFSELMPLIDYMAHTEHYSLYSQAEGQARVADRKGTGGGRRQRCSPGQT